MVRELHGFNRGTGIAPVAWIACDPDFKLPAQVHPGYAEKGAENVKKGAFEVEGCWS
jgi:hypothetical protein